MQRLAAGLFLVFALLWLSGFFAFINRLPEPSREPPVKSAGIAVYTGGGGARITAAMALFAEGGGERLLISGVNPETSRARLAELWSGSEDLFECCVDLGHKALSTEGNAAEASIWAALHGYDSIILVTSEYHMPRAILVTKTQMPDAVITPYAVSSGYLNEHGRPVSWEAWRKLSGEYAKYLIARLKVAFSGFGR